MKLSWLFTVFQRAPKMCCVESPPPPSLLLIPLFLTILPLQSQPFTLSVKVLFHDKKYYFMKVSATLFVSIHNSAAHKSNECAKIFTFSMHILTSRKAKGGREREKALHCSCSKNVDGNKIYRLNCPSERGAESQKKILEEMPTPGKA